MSFKSILLISFLITIIIEESSSETCKELENKHVLHILILLIMKKE